VQALARLAFLAAAIAAPALAQDAGPRSAADPPRAAAIAAPALAQDAGPRSAADPPRVTARASRSEVTVGEPFLVEVRASGPPGATFTFPPEASQETFELGPAPPDSVPAAAGTQRYRAVVFAIGDTELPPIPVRYRLADGSTGEVRTEPIRLRVASLLPKSESEQKLADVKEPVTIGVGRAFWVALGVAVLAVAVAVAWLVARRRRPLPVATVVAPALAPDQDARQALDALVASGRLARGEYRPFYIELTLIAKRYLERRLAAPIVEMTTAEMLAHLRSSPHGAGLAPTLRDLASAADQIKFARGAGLTEEAERHLAATRALIDALEAALRPAAPAAPAPAAAPGAVALPADGRAA
jgi:hypothetical protein